HAELTTELEQGAGAERPIEVAVQFRLGQAAQLFPRQGRHAVAGFPPAASSARRARADTTRSTVPALTRPPGGTTSPRLSLMARVPAATASASAASAARTASRSVAPRATSTALPSTKTRSIAGSVTA